MLFPTCAWTVLSPQRVILAPDCGINYLPREVAAGTLAAPLRNG